MSKRRIRALIASVATVIMWGLSFLSIKITVAVLPPMSQGAMRFAMAAIILFIIFKWKEPNTRLDKKDYPLMLISSLIGISLYFYLENTGVKLLTASSSSIIISAIPIMVLVVDRVIYKNPMSISKIIAIILSVIGVFLVVGANINELIASGQGLGYLAMVAAGIAWTTFNFATKPLFKKYSQLAIVTYQVIFGTLGFLPFAMFEHVNWQAFSETVLLNIAFLGVFCSALANYFYVFALDELGVNLLSLIINLIPIVTIIASFFIMDEKITLIQILGAALVLTSVYIANSDVKENKNES